MHNRELGESSVWARVGKWMTSLTGQFQRARSTNEVSTGTKAVLPQPYSTCIRVCIHNLASVGNCAQILLQSLSPKHQITHPSLFHQKKSNKEKIHSL